MRRTTVTLRVNGVDHEREIESRLLLSDFIRTELGLTGSHVGCEHGVCGCCTVMVDGAAARSCLLLTVQVEGSEVVTIEGLASDGQLHPVQAAFREAHGLQCGFCTPGFVMAITAFLEENRGRLADLGQDEIRSAVAGNLCRCTGYQNIVRAVETAARKMAGEDGR